jgi:hypothetical protein
MISTAQGILQEKIYHGVSQRKGERWGIIDKINIK